MKNDTPSDDLWIDILRLSNQTPPIKQLREKNKHEPTLTKAQKYRLTAIAKIPAKLAELNERLKVLYFAKRHYNSLAIPRELDEKISYVKKCIAQTNKRYQKYVSGKTYQYKNGTIIIDDYSQPYIQFFKKLITYEFNLWDKFTEWDYSTPEYIEQRRLCDLVKDKLFGEQLFKEWLQEHGTRRLIMQSNHRPRYFEWRQHYYNRLQILHSCLDCCDKEIFVSAKDGKWLIRHFTYVIKRLKFESSLNYTLPQEINPALTNEEYLREVRKNGPHFQKYTGYDLEEIRQARPLERLLTTAWHCQLRDDERALLISLAQECQSYFEQAFMQEIPLACQDKQESVAK